MSTAPTEALTSGKSPEQMVLISLEAPPRDRPVEVGEMVTTATVQASNIIRDAHELLINIFGGRMRRYETLLEATVERGLARFKTELAHRGYDGALGVRFSHPKIVDGGAEIIVYGTGFRFIETTASSS
ncbi:MAG: heavy metal-binding domain-containing protein [Myxococcota bacterium]